MAHTQLTDRTTDGLTAMLQHLHRPIVFEEPDRITAPDSWLAQIPFAFWIVDALQPRMLVELGTHTGNSYSSFAQAVKRLGLPTACFAVDTWQGDPHAGHYDEGVFVDLVEHHEPRYSAFSCLIHSTFEEALQHFSDGSIDLLHIDGYHTYDAVSHDFAAWLPKLSNRAVVLVHDINVRKGDFGVWRFWEEVSKCHPAFSFLHGCGLGVLAIGTELPESVRWLVTTPEEAPEVISGIRAFFSQRGQMIKSRLVQRELRAEIQRLQDLVVARDAEIGRLNEAYIARGDEIDRLVRVEIAARDAEIGRRHEEIAARDAEIARLGTEQASLASTAANLNSELAAAMTAGAQSQASLDARAEEVGRLVGEVDARKRQICRLINEAAEVSASLAAASGQIAALRASTSWRITAPLRVVGSLTRWLRRLFN